MSKLSLERLQKIREAAGNCLKPDNPGNDREMISSYDWLDTQANPEAVKSMADELINLRQLNQIRKQQRIIDRRRFVNNAPECVLYPFKEPK